MTKEKFDVAFLPGKCVLDTGVVGILKWLAFSSLADRIYLQPGWVGPLNTAQYAQPSEQNRAKLFFFWAVALNVDRQPKIFTKLQKLKNKNKYYSILSI